MSQNDVNKYVSINEDEDNVRIVVWDNGITKMAALTPDEARYIAKALNRIAWRVEARQ